MITIERAGERERYFGKNCPQGMIQIEFVGCDPKLRYSDYGYKPAKSAFIEIYVDGIRFRVDVGNVYNGSGSKTVRGIHINGPINLQVERTATNAVSIFVPESTKDASRPPGTDSAGLRLHAPDCVASLDDKSDYGHLSDAGTCTCGAEEANPAT